MKHTAILFFVVSLLVIALFTSILAQASCDLCNPNGSTCDAGKCVCFNGYYGDNCQHYYFIDTVEMLTDLGDILYSPLNYNSAYTLKWSPISSNTISDTVNFTLFANISWNNGLISLKNIDLAKFERENGNEYNFTPNYSTNDPIIHSTPSSDVNITIYYTDTTTQTQITVYSTPKGHYTFGLNSYSYNITVASPCTGTCSKGTQAINMQCLQFNGVKNSTLSNLSACIGFVDGDAYKAIDIKAQTQQCDLPEDSNENLFHYKCQNDGLCVGSPNFSSPHHCQCINTGFTGQWCENQLILFDITLLNTPTSIFIHKLTSSLFTTTDNYSTSTYTGNLPSYTDSPEKNSQLGSYFTNIVAYIAKVANISPKSIHIERWASFNYEIFEGKQYLNTRIIFSLNTADYTLLDNSAPFTSLVTKLQHMYDSIETIITSLATTTNLSQIPQETMGAQQQTILPFATAISRYSTPENAIFDPNCAKFFSNCPTLGPFPLEQDDYEQISVDLAPYLNSGSNDLTPISPKKKKKSTLWMAIVIPIVIALVAVFIGLVILLILKTEKDEKTPNLIDGDTFLQTTPTSRTGLTSDTA